MIRLLAALVVFFLHTAINLGSPIYAFPLAPLFYAPAWGGVWIFVAIAGYWAGRGFSKTAAVLTPKAIAAYYWSKIKRIYWPAFCMFLGFSVFMMSQTLVQAPLTLFSKARDMGTWYLFMMFWLYFLAPYAAILLRPLGKGRHATQVYLALFAVVLLAGGFYRYAMYCRGIDWQMGVYRKVAGNADLFFAGMLAGFLPAPSWTVRTWRWVRKANGVLLAALLLFNCYAYYLGSTGYPQWMDIYCYVLPSVYAVVVCSYLYTFDRSKQLAAFHVRHNWIGKTVKWLSTISFEIYLVQDYIHISLAPHFAQDGMLGTYLLFTLFSAGFTLYFAYGLHRIFDTKAAAAVGAAG